MVLRPSYTAQPDRGPAFLPDLRESFSAVDARDYAPQSLMALMPRRSISSRWLRTPCSTSGGCGSQSKISPTTRNGCWVR